ncbi:PREDICTED: BTB/POZ domain-containing protein KCTD12-like [Priapulus caudatus]|uniref:BTB/POZ domain-containing protein KCTD12-like n=1 Tax=Priapulus caudatus TaxID=37621 RepID=A0ABM1EVS7_PRICU|nr:PREDICTED: BTB/POZ domain-containing protein KCTD12-like [Priapulus caudatus]
MTTSAAATTDFPTIIELNVGGVFYTTSLKTICNDPDSLLCHMFTGKAKRPLRDGKGKYFIDRDGVLFRYVLDYIRNQRLVLPENFHEKERLRSEAESFKLDSMVASIEKAVISHTHQGVSSSSSSSAAPSTTTSRCGYITVGYRGTFAFGRDGLADVKFRKLSRILVCGRVSLCRAVFVDTLNESRDPDRGSDDRYTSRFFLKHNFLEQAFDNLSDAGFTLLTACASGTSSGLQQPDVGKNQAVVQFDSEENKWNHYNEFIFYRP